MNIYGTLVGFLCAGAACCGAVSAQGLSIKEYELGAQMKECPSGTINIISKAPETLCQLSATTLANQPVTSAAVGFYKGQVSTVFFSLLARGQYANSDVLQALKEKFGLPSQSETHINRYAWYRGTQSLIFDGWKGTVLLMDQLAQEQIKGEKAKQNRSDL